jgi:hypothetical protein
VSRGAEPCDEKHDIPSTIAFAGLNARQQAVLRRYVPGTGRAVVGTATDAQALSKKPADIKFRLGWVLCPFCEMHQHFPDGNREEEEGEEWEDESDEAEGL